MQNHRGRFRVASAALLSFLACASLGGCAGYQLAGAGPKDAPQPGSQSVPRAHQLRGESLSLEKSGCPLPAEPTFYVLDFLIDSDGTAKDVKFVRGAAPTECIRSHVEKVVSTWRFEPPTVDGQPAQLRYSVGFSAPASAEK